MVSRVDRGKCREDGGCDAGFG